MAKFMQIQIPLAQAVVWFCCLLLPLLGGASVTGYYKHRLETVEIHLSKLTEVLQKTTDNQILILQELATIKEELRSTRK